MPPQCSGGYKLKVTQNNNVNKNDTCNIRDSWSWCSVKANTTKNTSEEVDSTSDQG